MGLSDLKMLLVKKNIIFTILICWLIFAWTLFFFLPDLFLTGVGVFIFYPLLVACLILFLYSLLFRAEITKISGNWKDLLKAAGIFVVLAIIYYLIGTLAFRDMIQLFVSLMFVVSIFSLIFITALFSMQYCFEYGVKVDDIIYKSPRSISVPARWGLFLFGVLISILMILYLPSYLAHEAPLVPKETNSKDISVMLFWVAILSIGMIISLGIATIVISFIKGRFNAWIGIYLIFIGCYISFLMINALFTVEKGQSLPLLIARISMYVFELFLLLITISSLIGKKAEQIGEKLKFIKSDTILLWLIFAKAAFVFSDLVLPPGELTTMKSIAVFFLFLPLAFFFAISGFYQYAHLKRIRIAKKQIAKVKKDREQAKKEREEAKRQAREEAQKKREQAKKERKKSNKKKKKKENNKFKNF